MSRPTAEALQGLVVRAEVADAFGYEPTRVTLIYDDGRRVTLTADSVAYDQYSRSPCLTMKVIP